MQKPPQINAKTRFDRVFKKPLVQAKKEESLQPNALKRPMRNFPQLNAKAKTDQVIKKPLVYAKKEE